MKCSSPWVMVNGTLRPFGRCCTTASLAERELYDVDVDHVFPGIGRKIMQLNARLVSHGTDVSGLILLAIEDVTERRLAERLLAVQRRELERSNTALNEFAFVASHDLQEPLRKIVSFGERLGTSAGPLLEGNARQYLDRMLDAATRMRALIADLLAYSQIKTNAAAFAPTSLAAIVREVVADLETAIADTGGRIEVGTLPAIDADASQMRQLVQNLLSNALKFRRPDVAPVIQARRLDLARRRLHDHRDRQRNRLQAGARRKDLSNVRATPYPDAVSGLRHGTRDLPKDRRASRRQHRRDEHRRSGNDVHRQRSPSTRRKWSTRHDDARQAQDSDHDSHLR